FPEKKTTLKRWRNFVRSLLLSHLSPSQVATIETAWLLPVDHTRGFVVLRSHPRPVQFPLRPLPVSNDHRASIASVRRAYSRARNQLKGLESMVQPVNWRRMIRIRERGVTVGFDWQPVSQGVQNRDPG